MYLWFGEGNFFFVPLAPITEYKDWTSERFLNEVAKLVDEYSTGNVDDG